VRRLGEGAALVGRRLVSAAEEPHARAADRLEPRSRAHRAGERRCRARALAAPAHHDQDVTAPRDGEAVRREELVEEAGGVGARREDAIRDHAERRRDEETAPDDPDAALGEAAEHRREGLSRAGRRRGLRLRRRVGFRARRSRVGRGGRGEGGERDEKDSGLHRLQLDTRPESLSTPDAARAAGRKVDRP
jgi:hypothetical protein